MFFPPKIAETSRDQFQRQDVPKIFISIVYPAIVLIIVYPCCEYCQVPDITMNGDEQVDAVVLDDDAVGAPDGNGDGAKILRGEGALDFFLGNQKRPSKVRSVAGFDGRRASMIVSLKNHNYHILGLKLLLDTSLKSNVLSMFTFHT